MNRLAIIPARGGSKRIPKKNIKNFCGKPMINHALETCKKSKLFKKIHVSTEDLQVKKTVENFGLKVDFLRPKHLADDITPIMPVLKYVTKKYIELDQHFNQIWLILPCCPLITSYDLINAENFYENNNHKNKLMAVSKYPAPIDWAYKKNSLGILKAVKPGAFERQSQSFEPYFYDTGTFYIFSTTDIIASNNAGDGNDFIPFEIPFFKAIDIDTELDWHNAEKMFKIL